MAKSSSIAIYGGSSVSILFGLSPSDWQILGIVGGMLLGIAGFVVNVWFKWAHYQLAKQRGEPQFTAGDGE